MKNSIKCILLLGTALGAGVLTGCTESGQSPLAPRRELVAPDHRAAAGPTDQAAEKAAAPQPLQKHGESTGTSAAGTLPRFSGYLLASN